MPSEEKHKINVWIPENLWKQIESLGHESPTKATIAAFEALVLQEALGSNQEAIRQAQKESRYIEKEERLYDTVQENAGIEEKKGSLETTCLNCGEVFTAERSTRKFCSGKCKAAYYRKKSKEEII